jgi:tetratricopeptide (TPR) repeat protein
VNAKLVLAFLLGLVLGLAGGYIFTDLHYRNMELQAPAPAAGAAGGPAAPGAGAMADAHEKLRALERRVQENPKDVDALVALANLYYDISQFARAIPYYERALAEKPGNPNVQADLGTCYRETGEPLKAVEHYEASFKADPTHWRSVFNALVVSLHDLKDAQRARGYLEKLKTLKPPDIDLQALEAEVAKLGTP